MYIDDSPFAKVGCYMQGINKNSYGFNFFKANSSDICKLSMFSIFLCKEKNVNLYSAYCHIKLISWCCCNYFVQCTEIQSISENQTTSAEVVLYRIPNMFSASNHMVYTACMLKGPFPFFQKNHFSSKFI